MKVQSLMSKRKGPAAVPEVKLVCQMGWFFLLLSHLQPQAEIDGTHV